MKFQDLPDDCISKEYLMEGMTRSKTYDAVQRALNSTEMYRRHEEILKNNTRDSASLMNKVVGYEF